MTEQLSSQQTTGRRVFTGLATLLAALLVAAPLASSVGASPASATTSPTSTALRVLLIGASDPTTAAWQAALGNEGVPYTEVGASTTAGLGNWTVKLPALTATGDPSQGLFNGVVIADMAADFAPDELSALFAYESSFGVRQIDGYSYPSPSIGLTEAASGVLDGTGATLTSAGLSTFPALKGPVPFDTGTYGYPATVATGLPAGASETPLLEADPGTQVGGVTVSDDVLMGIYQHPNSTSDPQSGVAELTIGFDYNASQLQWLILGPELIDWVTGGEHLGLYRNYIGQDVDDIFIADNVWSTKYQCTPGATDPSDFTCPPDVANNPADTPPDVQMSAADVDYVVTWEKQNSFTLNLAFNGSGACTAPSTSEESRANCGGSTTINGQTYADPGQDTSDATVANDSAFVDEILANQASFNWITHTWSHEFLGCTTWQPMAINAPTTGSEGQLAAGTYYYEVTAATAYGESEPSLAASATLSSSGSVVLTWPDATNGGGPSLAELESEFSGGTGFWGYYVYRSTSSTGPFGLVGQVAEDPTGTQTSYSFTDTGTETPGGSPSSSSSFPTATNPGIECAPGGWDLASSTSPDSSIDQEIGLDVAFAQANGLTNFSPSAVVTGEHSGLESPEMPTAFADMGITTFAADASRQPNQYSISGTSGAMSDTAYSSPRFPTNIYYNAPSWADEINEYNTLYVAEGVSIGDGETGRCVDTSSTTCLTGPATQPDILASESRIELGHVLNNDPRVTFAHQSNLIGPDYTLLSLLSDILGQYNSWYSSYTPYVQTTDVSASQILREQAAWAQAAGNVSAVTSDGVETVTNTGTSPIDVPITAPQGSITSLGASFGSPYGDTVSAWVTLAPNGSVSIDVPPIAQAISFTSTAPTNAIVNGTSYTVTATGGGSDEPISFSVDSSSDGACSISGSTVSFSAVGTCVIDANQGGNSQYAAAPQVTQSFPVAGMTQAISFTSTAPTNAIVNGTSYTVTATGGGSDEPISFSVDSSSDGACSISGSTVSFSAVGTCVIDANQGGNSQYAAAPQVTQSFPVAGMTQAISFTSTAPTNAIVNGTSYTVTATGGGSDEPISFSVDSSSDGACSISGSTVSFSAVGTCVIDANQGGNSQYAAAPQVTQSFPVAGMTQAISFTSTAPTNAIVNGTSYTVTATGGGSDEPISFSVDSSSDGACSISGSTVSFSAVGTCVIDANQGGNSQYAAAPQVTQSFPVAGMTQAISFTSTAPTNAIVNGTSYTVTATGGGSDEPISFSVDSSSDGACSISGSTVSFSAVGTCVIDANQGGNSQYAAAPQVTQSFPVAGMTQAISFTSTAPTNAIVNGTSYTVTATGGGSDEPISFSVDSSSDGACSISGSTVSFSAVGTCVIDANQGGNSQYAAAPQVTQSFPVAGMTQAISFTSTAPTNAIVNGTSYTVTATGGGSDEPISFSVDSSSDGACSISGSTVSFSAVGTCVIDANQGGNSQYAAAPQVTQSFPVSHFSTTTKVSMSPTTVTYGHESASVFTATVTGRSNLTVPNNEHVTVHVGSVGCTVVLKTGKGTCKIANAALPAGSYSVSAIYSGDAKLEGSNGSSSSKLTVKPDKTTIKLLLSKTTVTYGNESASVLTASVTTHNGETVPNGERVTVIMGSAKCTLVLNRGRQTCKIANTALPVGSYSVSAVYGGDANLTGSKTSSAFKLTVS